MDKLIDWIASADSTTIAALIAAFAAIIAPVITSYMAHTSARKLKSLELFYASKTDAYSKFLSAAALTVPKSFDPDDMPALIEASAIAKLYSSKETNELITEYCRALVLADPGSDNYVNLGYLSADVVTAMQKELDEFKK